MGGKGGASPAIWDWRVSSLALQGSVTKAGDSPYPGSSSARGERAAPKGPVLFLYALPRSMCRNKGVGRRAEYLARAARMSVPSAHGTGFAPNCSDLPRIRAERLTNHLLPAGVEKGRL
jgi:hypothetical protein